VIASTEEYAALMTAFGKGWEKGRPDQILEVFATDAVFRPSPFDAALNGKDEISQYWKDTPAEQSEISFRHGEIYSVGPWFSTEFKCTFRRRRTGQWVDVRGALFCETSNGKISEMRMYWDRTVGGRAV
jgi:ketosteroid isomerase-like protein